MCIRDRVVTAEELQVAVTSGAAFIEVVEHLNLASLQLINSSNEELGAKLLGTVPSAVKSITVRCCSYMFVCCGCAICVNCWGRHLENR